MDIVALLSLWAGELVPMYNLVSLYPSLAECLNYSLRHIFSSSLCQFGGNQSITSSFVWNIWLKHWSIMFYCWFVWFICSLLLCLGYRCGVNSSFLLNLFVDSSWCFTYWPGPKVEHLKKGVMDNLIYWIYL